jgi:hypothetical protein
MDVQVGCLLETISRDMPQVCSSSIARTLEQPPQDEAIKIV